MSTPSLHDDSARAGRSGHLPLGRKPVLLRVDSVKAYLEPGSPLYAPAFKAALQHGFVPHVVREACGDRDARPQEAKLFELQAKYAEAVDEDFAVGLLGSHNTTR